MTRVVLLLLDLSDRSQCGARTRVGGEPVRPEVRRHNGGVEIRIRGPSCAAGGLVRRLRGGLCCCKRSCTGGDLTLEEIEDSRKNEPG